jgi:hypothetical protein
MGRKYVIEEKSINKFLYLLLKLNSNKYYSKSEIAEKIGKTESYFNKYLKFGVEQTDYIYLSSVLNLDENVIEQFIPKKTNSIFSIKRSYYKQKQKDSFKLKKSEVLFKLLMQFKKNIEDNEKLIKEVNQDTFWTHFEFSGKNITQIQKELKKQTGKFVLQRVLSHNLKSIAEYNKGIIFEKGGKGQERDMIFQIVDKDKARETELKIHKRRLSDVNEVYTYFKGYVYQDIIGLRRRYISNIREFEALKTQLEQGVSKADSKILLKKFSTLSFELREYDLYAVRLLNWLTKLGYGGETAN